MKFSMKYFQQFNFKILQMVIFVKADNIKIIISLKGHVIK